MRRFALACLLAAVSVVACHRHKVARDGSRTARSAPTDEETVEPESRTGASHRTERATGTCESSCEHYLECKGNVEPNARPVCLQRCAQMGLSRQALLQYEATDCATAISQAEGAANKGRTAPAASDCQGCVWDGSSCIWLSQGNWGAGPYSGAAAACNRACCPGH